MKKHSFIKSLSFAITGIVTCVKQERNMKIHLLATLLVVAAGFIFSISIVEWLFCITSFTFVIVCEMFNTAIEVNTDLTTSKIDEKARITKDVAAGAVLVSTLYSVIIGVIIFFPKIFNF